MHKKPDPIYTNYNNIRVYYIRGESKHEAGVKVSWTLISTQMCTPEFGKTGKYTFSWCLLQTVGTHKWLVDMSAQAVSFSGIGLIIILNNIFLILIHACCFYNPTERLHGRFVLIKNVFVTPQQKANILNKMVLNPNRLGFFNL